MGLEDGMGPFSSYRSLVEGLHALAGLRTFWTKHIERVELVSSNPLRLEDLRRTERDCRRALFMVSNSRIAEFLEEVKNGRSMNDDARCIVVTTLELDPSLYDRWSVVYVYTRDSRLLEPNHIVEVEVHEDASEEVLQKVEAIQRRSWGFYMLPRKDRVAFIAKLGGRPVGATYYHAESSNIDYGVHVVRDYWRNRIGTRILHEVKRYTESLGKK